MASRPRWNGGPGPCSGRGPGNQDRVGGGAAEPQGRAGGGVKEHQGLAKLAQAGLGAREESATGPLQRWPAHLY